MVASRPDVATFPPLRAWQRKALVEYLRRRDEDFLAVATPGAGKTTFALRIAAELLSAGTVAAVTVVTPTEHLKSQWARAAGAVGIQLDPAFRNADVHSSADFHGAVVTYAQVGMAPAVHRRRTTTRPTLVILDEIHHAGDSRTWGDGVKSAFEPAVRRLMLTGTPFRSDDNPIPFVTYERGPDGLARSRSDSSYGYADALAEGVVRPVIFLAYSGETRWRTSAGDELTARAGIAVFATGGLGGVHRGAAYDESADLVTLARTPILVVCAGVKSILDVGATLERLETLGVTVVGYRSRRFPGFYLTDGGFDLDWSVDSPAELADVLKARDAQGVHPGAVVVANPLPVTEQLDPDQHDRVLREGLAGLERDGITGKAVTPYLLAHFHHATAGASLDVNVRLVLRNATVAAQVAVEYAPA